MALRQDGFFSGIRAADYFGDCGSGMGDAGITESVDARGRRIVSLPEVTITASAPAPLVDDGEDPRFARGEEAHAEASPAAAAALTPGVGAAATPSSSAGALLVGGLALLLLRGRKNAKGKAKRRAPARRRRR